MWEALRRPTRGSPALCRVLLGSSVCGWGVLSSNAGLLGAGMGGRLVASTCLWPAETDRGLGVRRGQFSEGADRGLV